jgi:hypothetical protein
LVLYKTTQVNAGLGIGAISFELKYLMASFFPTEFGQSFDFWCPSSFHISITIIQISTIVEGKSTKPGTKTTTNSALQHWDYRMAGG